MTFSFGIHLKVKKVKGQELRYSAEAILLLSNAKLDTGIAISKRALAVEVI